MPTILLMVEGDSAGLPRPGCAASLARKASTSALLIAARSRVPNAGNKCASKITSTACRCRRRHCGAISARQVTEKSKSVGVESVVATGRGATGPAMDALENPFALASSEAKVAAFGLFGNVAA